MHIYILLLWLSCFSTNVMANVMHVERAEFTVNNNIRDISETVSATCEGQDSCYFDFNNIPDYESEVAKSKHYDHVGITFTCEGMPGMWTDKVVFNKHNDIYVDCDSHRQPEPIILSKLVTQWFSNWFLNNSYKRQ